MKPYYERDGITIYCGDCLEVMPRLKGPFDAIICDPPYGTTACSWDEVIPFEPLWENYKRLVKGNGAVVLFGSEPFSSLLRISNFENYKYDWVWIKNTSTGITTAEKRPLKRHEMISVFYGKIYNPQPTARIDKSGRARYPMSSGVSVHTPGLKPLKPKQYNPNNRYPSSILEFSTDPNSLGKLHPTQKPLPLLAYLIRTYTNPSEIILDNTMGSGTTLLAAQNEGRQAIGVEIDESYCKIAIERLRQPSFFSIPDRPKDETAKQLTLITPFDNPLPLE